MKRYGLGLGALLLLAGPAFAGDVPEAVYPASPPPAGSPLYSPTSVVTGDFTLALGWTGTNEDFNDNSATGHVAGRVNIPLWSGWNEEIEATGVWQFNNDAFTAGAFGHTYYKNQSWAGGFVIGGGANDPFGTDSNGFFTTGIEGVVFLSKASIVGKADYNWSDGPDFWTLSLEGRYYFEPNTKLTGLVAWSDIGADEWLLYGALEHRWQNTPFSTFVTADWRPSGGGGDSQWGVMVGFRYLFDQPNGTLQSHDFEVPFSQGHDTVF